jgi:hypothetical protein
VCFPILYDKPDNDAYRWGYFNRDTLFHKVIVHTLLIPSGGKVALQQRRSFVQLHGIILCINPVYICIYYQYILYLQYQRLILELVWFRYVLGG